MKNKEIFDDVKTLSKSIGYSLKTSEQNFNHQSRVYEDIVDLIASPENPIPLIKLNGRINPNRKFPVCLKL